MSFQATLQLLYTTSSSAQQQTIIFDYNFLSVSLGHSQHHGRQTTQGSNNGSNKHCPCEGMVDDKNKDRHLLRKSRQLGLTIFITICKQN